MAAMMQKDINEAVQVLSDLFELFLAENAIGFKVFGREETLSTKMGTETSTRQS